MTAYSLATIQTKGKPEAAICVGGKVWPLAAAAKDAGSAAVLLSITGAVVVWVIVFLWPVH